MAILIGCAASRIGSGDPLLSKTLCLHLPTLLPPQHGDIDISNVVQTSALMGLGLLHSGSGNRLMTEFLLTELVRKPPSNRCDIREAMSLVASLALGLILLGKGSKAYSPEVLPSASSTVTSSKFFGIGGGLDDLCVEERLQKLIDGGKRPESSIFMVKK